MAGGPLAELGHPAERGPGHHGGPHKRRTPWVSDPHRRAHERQPGTEIRRHHLRARHKLVPEEPCVTDSRPCTRRSAARPYKRQPPDHLRAGPSPVPSAARAARCAAHAPATDPWPGRSPATAPPRLRPAATGGRSPSSTPRRAQGLARLDAVCGKRRLSTPAVVPAHQSLAPPRHPTFFPASPHSPGTGEA